MWSAVSVTSTDALSHAKELMVTDMEFLLASSMPGFILLKVASCHVPVVEQVIMKMQKANMWTQQHTRNLDVKFLNCLHALEYQLHAGMIFATLLQLYDKKLAQRFLEWEIIFKKIALIRKQHIYF